jgi:DNA-binding transcriptional LysR family regulator
MRELFPNLILQPYVDMSGPLQEQVIDGRLDLAILPEPELPASVERVTLGSARFAWFCRPGAFDSKRTVPLRELGTVPVIEQIPVSIITILSSRSFESAGVDPERGGWGWREPAAGRSFQTANPESADTNRGYRPAGTAGSL